MNVLTIQNLSKSFGKQKIIDNLNLSVPERSVFGFIGKNGAGKTTTMKMVLGTKVAINQKDDKKGKIEIEYYSMDELDRIIDLIRTIGK